MLELRVFEMVKPHYILPSYYIPILPRQLFHLGFFRAWGNQFSTQNLECVLDFSWIQARLLPSSHCSAIDPNLVRKHVELALSRPHITHEK